MGVCLDNFKNIRTFVWCLVTLSTNRHE